MCAQQLTATAEVIVLGLFGDWQRTGYCFVVLILVMGKGVPVTGAIFVPCRMD